VSPTARLRLWLYVLAVALLALVVLALLSRRRPVRPAQVEEEEPAAAAPAPARKPPRLDETSALRGKVAELNAELEQVRAAQARARREEARACVTTLSDDCPFLDPSHEVLLELARCGTLKLDQPDLDATQARPDDEGNVSEEAESVAQATREVNGAVRDELRGLHADLGLAGDLPAKLRDLMQAVEAGLPRGDVPDIHRRLSRERAGLLAPPANPSSDPTERYWRLRAGLGDQYEQALAQKVGRERAHALRKAHDGWSFRGIYTSGQCAWDAGM
jgi:hypothetical protein